MNINHEKLKLQQKAVDLFQNNRHFLLEWATGTSKTKAVYDCIKSVYKKGETICMVTKILAGRNALKKELQKWWPDAPIENITWKTYIWYAGYERENSDKLFNYDYVVLDEAHHVSKSFMDSAFSYFKTVADVSTQDRKLKVSKYPKNLLLLSATIDNNKKNFFGKKLKVFTYGIEESTKNNITAKHELIEKPINVTSKVKRNIKSKYDDFYYSVGFNAKAYNELTRYIAQQKEKVVKEFVKSIKGKTLVFCDSIKQAERISPYSYHSKKSKAEAELCLSKFNEGSISLLSAVNALDESVNISELDNIIILQGDGNKRRYLQRLGRVIRFRENHVGRVYYFYVKETIDEYWFKKVTGKL